MTFFLAVLNPTHTPPLDFLEALRRPSNSTVMLPTFAADEQFRNLVSLVASADTLVLLINEETAFVTSCGATESLAVGFHFSCQLRVSA